MRTLRTSLLSFAAAGLIMGGVASTAHAAPAFTVDPGNLGFTPGGSFTATDFSGVSSVLITETSGSGGIGSTQSEAGWVEYSEFTNSSIPVAFEGPGTGASYGVYLVFTATTQTIVGTLGSATNQNVITSFQFALYADPNNGTANQDVTQNAASGASPTAATLSSEGHALSSDGSGNTGGDVLLGGGTLLVGSTSFNLAGGPALNATTSLFLCSGNGASLIGSNAVANANCKGNYGTQFFTKPVPFYDVTFSESNSTPSNVTESGTFPAAGSNAAIVSESVQSNFVAVPEPTSLAMFGAGLLGLGLLARRSRRRAR